MKIKDFFGLAFMILVFMGLILLFIYIMGLRFSNYYGGGYLEQLNYKEIYFWRFIGVIGVGIPLIAIWLYVRRLSQKSEEVRKV
jgi:hypothetical protein